MAQASTRGPASPLQAFECSLFRRPWEHRLSLSHAVTCAVQGYGIPDITAMPDAELERLVAEFQLVPNDPRDDYTRAQGYLDIIRAELAARRVQHD
jgi:hypothetical protein